MKKYRVNKLFMVLMAGAVLSAPLSARASEAGMQNWMDDGEELLTAGVGDLFATVLSEEEYREIAKKAEGALWGYTELGICNVEENNLNIRKEPNESGSLVGKLPKNAACEIVSNEDGWAYVKSGKVDGYVKAEYLLTGYEAKKKGEQLASMQAVSVADGLNIREQPNTEAEVVTQVASGEALDIVEIRKDGWEIGRASCRGLCFGRVC